MNQAAGVRVLQVLAWLVVSGWLCLGMAHADDRSGNLAATLHAKYTSLQNQLNHNAFQRPLYLDSSEISGVVTGDIFALVNYPIATVDAALNEPGNWCDILLLHLNIKYCHASSDSRGVVLNVSIGKKFDQPLEDAYRVDFSYRVAASTANYLQIDLSADKGPLSTRNYRIMLEAVPLADGQTFIHLSYSYAYGMIGQLAMQGYLVTIGQDKVGFTVIGNQSDSQPRYIGGMRGVVERNTMRYYLAIETFLGALSAPSPARVEKRFHDWFAACERYPRQLHELDQNEYLVMKRNEYLRQQAN
jgi:hypothetical protein